MPTTHPAFTTPDWSPAVQALASVVLAVVTIVYVILTYRLVKHADRQASAVVQAQHEQARERRRLALRSIQIELQQISDFQPASTLGRDPTPRQLPCESWERFAGELGPIATEARDTLVEVYGLVRICNARCDRCLPNASGASQIGPVVVWANGAKTAAKRAANALSLLPADT